MTHLVLTMTRQQMEAHLLLHDWVPFDLSMGGALKDSGIIYVFTMRGSFANGGGAIAKTGLRSVGGLGLTELQLKERMLDSWEAMDDEHFWLMAKQCVDRDVPRSPSTKLLPSKLYRGY